MKLNMIHKQDQEHFSKSSTHVKYNCYYFLLSPLSSMTLIWIPSIGSTRIKRTLICECVLVRTDFLDVTFLAAFDI